MRQELADQRSDAPGCPGERQPEPLLPRFSTILVVSCPSHPTRPVRRGCAAPAGGVYATFTNAGQLNPPTITTNIDLNNPANFQWNNGRVNLQDEKRYEFTQGAHADYTWGGDLIALKAGAAYDDIFRNITAIDASNIWSDAACGDNPSNALAPPNRHAGLPWLERRGFGRHRECGVGGRGAGLCRLWHRIYRRGHAYHLWRLADSAIGAGQLSDPGPDRLHYGQLSRVKAASNYYAIDQAAINAVGNALPGTTGTYPYSTASNSGGNSGTVEEKDYGLYLENPKVKFLL